MGHLIFFAVVFGAAFGLYLFISRGYINVWDAIVKLLIVANFMYFVALVVQDGFSFPEVTLVVVVFFASTGISYEIIKRIEESP